MKSLQAMAVMGTSLSLALTSCSPVGSALADDGSVSNAICAPADGNGELLVAMDILSNEGSATAEIRGVQIQDGSNLEIVAFAALEEDADGSRGVLHLADAEMAQNRLVNAGEEAFLQVLVALENPAEPGSAKSLQVRYADAGSTREKTKSTVTSIELLPAGRAC